jgi:hypothetical protein
MLLKDNFLLSPLILERKLLLCRLDTNHSSYDACDYEIYSIKVNLQLRLDKSSLDGGFSLSPHYWHYQFDLSALFLTFDIFYLH